MVCNENSRPADPLGEGIYVDPLDEGIRVDDEDPPSANYSVNFVTSETCHKSYRLTASERTPLIHGYIYIYISKNI